MEKTTKNTPTRHTLRVKVVENLYRQDINQTTELDINEHEFVKAMVEGVMKEQNKLDELITNHLTKWTIKRLSYVDRAILRLAVYEMYATDTPGEIIINEALNLTKTFTDEGDNKAVSFNNSVLDKIKKTLKK